VPTVVQKARRQAGEEEDVNIPNTEDKEASRRRMSSMVLLGILIPPKKSRLIYKRTPVVLPLCLSSLIYVCSYNW
jgi:hypothetical protein